MEGTNSKLEGMVGERDQLSALLFPELNGFTCPAQGAECEELYSLKLLAQTYSSMSFVFPQGEK